VFIEVKRYILSVPAAGYGVGGVIA